MSPMIRRTQFHSPLFIRSSDRRMIRHRVFNDHYDYERASDCGLSGAGAQLALGHVAVNS
jgi:hypothetical protein